MAVVGDIVNDKTLKKVGTFRVDTNAITLDVRDTKVLAALKNGLRKEWPVEAIPDTPPENPMARIVEFAVPKGESTIAHFYAMLYLLGFYQTNITLVE
jgi:hypothetical protein